MAIEDFGKKIGGARKDLRGSFNASDVANLTHLERIKLVRKDMVWPTPDFAGMVESGQLTQNGAAMIKMLRDGLPPAPLPCYSPTEADFQRACDTYVPVLNAVKNAIAGCRDVPNIMAAIRSNPDLHSVVGFCVEKPSPYDGRTVLTLEHGEGLRAFISGNPNSRFGATNAIAHGIQCAWRGVLDRDIAKLFDENPEWPMATSRVDTAIRKGRASVGPLKTGGFGLLLRGSEPPRTNWDYYSARTPFGAMFGKTFETAEAANAALRDAVESHFKGQHEKRKAKAAEVLGKVKPATDAPTYRTGPDYRNGSLATGQDYLDHFGLRGGEFGNWLNEVDRQQVLDRGFDAYRDLADVLGWAPDQISLGGTQAIAFGARGNGARGRGGMTPAAHYEPGRRVTNLTKPAGEGCLAHEWGHALDHHLGERARTLGLPVIGDEHGILYLSSATLLEAHLAKVAPENLDDARKLVALNASMRLLSTHMVRPERAVYLESMTKQRERVFQAMRAALPPLLHSLRYRAERNKKVSGSELDQIVAQCDAELQRWNKPEVIVAYSTELPKTVEILRDLVGRRASLSNVEEALRPICAHGAGVIPAVEKAVDPAFVPPLASAKTEFYRESRKIDVEMGGSKAYWSSSEELFARAFEACVEDALVKGERFNPFLVCGSHGKAYPMGAERTAIVANLLPAIQACGVLIPRVRHDSPTAPVPDPAAISVQTEAISAVEDSVPVAASVKATQMDLFAAAPEERPPIDTLLTQIEGRLARDHSRATTSISP